MDKAILIGEKGSKIRDSGARLRAIGLEDPG
jgi:hypothetical protein